MLYQTKNPHGGEVYEKPHLLDFSANINPLGTPPSVKKAVEGLCVCPDVAYIDGNRVPNLKIPAIPVVKGDAVSASIAAASILAKVSRDRFMLELDRQYPQYGFARHKGYPTKEHYERIGRYGISPVHRISFLKNLDDHLKGEKNL